MRPDPRLHPRGDGDGWVICAGGHRHWGVHGAAGLLVVAEHEGAPAVLLQHRAEWTHYGGTWGLLGGARQRRESAVAAASREAAEEGGLDAAAATVWGEYVDDHGGWSYTTVLATAPALLAAEPTGLESAEVRWLSHDAVEEQALHPGFAASWPLLRAELEPVRIVVDAANVVGSRPDGWWRDRAGAAARLLQRIDALAACGLAAGDLPAPSGLHRAWPRWEVVLEGAARGARRPGGADGGDPRVQVVAADGSGDDTIAARAAAPTGRTVVVTADRGLADRARRSGASVTGPGWLLRILDRLAVPARGDG